MMETINVPKSQIARDKILDWIREGRITAGEKLHSERELAKSFAIYNYSLFQLGNQAYL